MTSANVSNMTIQTATSKTSAGYGGKQESQSDFLQVMSSVSGKDRTISFMPKNEGRNMADTAMKVQTKPNEIKKPDSGIADGQVAEKVSDEVNDFSEKVKDVISEELDVSEEEIEDAMETLGLTFLDLTDVTNMTKLVSMLTNCEDKVSLLVNESFTNIVSNVENLAEALMDHTQMSLEDVQGMMNLITDTMPENKPFEMTEELVSFGEPEEMVPEKMAEVQDADTTKNPANAQNVQAVDTRVESSQDVKETVAVTEESQETEEEPLTQGTEDDLTFEQAKNTAENDGTKNDFSQNNRQKQESFLTGQTVENQMGDMGLRSSGGFEPITGEITLQTGETVNVKEIINQIVENARTTITADNTTLEMLLNPEGLGKILMEVTQKDGKVSAHIYTQDENVKQALENQMVQLKEQMNQSGTKVNSIEVSVGTHEFERNLEEGQQGQNQEDTQEKQGQHRTRNLNMNNLDELSGLMTEEEELVAKMMRDNGNSVNYTA